MAVLFFCRTIRYNKGSSEKERSNEVVENHHRL